MVGEYIENKCAPVEEEIVNADACSSRGEVIFHENSDLIQTTHHASSLSKRKITQNKKDKATQIGKPCRCYNNQKQFKSVAVQTFITAERLKADLFTKSAKMTSTSSQTDETKATLGCVQLPFGTSDIGLDDNRFSKTVDKNDRNEYDLEQDTDSEEFVLGDTNSEDSEFEDNINSNVESKCTSKILSRNKLPQDQRKFIVFEDSLVECFDRCSKCGSKCLVSVANTIGTFSRISVQCLLDETHSFTWCTGPLCNRLPVFHLMLASGILATGLECAKVLRLLSALKIKCFTRREFSRLQSAYVIPAVFNVWGGEKKRLLQKLKGQTCCIASDMRVDSPGHSGLFGSGSSLDVDNNVILDTQIIKVMTEVINIL